MTEVWEAYNYFEKHNMIRTAKISLSVIGFLVTATVVAINFNSAISFIGILAFSAILFYFIVCTDGLFTGYTEKLNSDVILAKENIGELIQSSKKSVKIVSATLSPAIYSQPEVFEKIKSAKNRGVDFEIIIDSKKLSLSKIKPKTESNISNFFEFWNWVKNNEIKIRCYKGKPWPHFIIIDDLHTRVEDKHKIVYYPDARFTKRRAKTHLLNPEIAKKYSSKFEKLKLTSEPYYSA